MIRRYPAVTLSLVAGGMAGPHCIAPGPPPWPAPMPFRSWGSRRWRGCRLPGCSASAITSA